MNITTIGIDLAKNVFQIHGADERGKCVLKKRVSRKELVETMANLPRAVVGIEAAGGAHYWARKLGELGHEVRIMAPQHVKPYVKSNKNDANDAEAICEAVSRPTMRFVPIKSVEQQDLQMIHRIRERLVKARTALVNETRGLLAEYGIVMPQGITKFRKTLFEVLASNKETLTSLASELLNDLYEELKTLDAQIEKHEKKLKQIYKSHPVCQKLSDIPGVGPLTATAIVSSIGDTKAFKNGRHFAAWLGLVPSQHSSGGKERLLGISKRGDTYLRTLLIHGARSAVRVVGNKTDRRSLWTQALVERRGINKASVAFANKNARTIWALIAYDKKFQAA